MSFHCQKKEIVYRGGIVRFFIPASWQEEYEQDGGGTFYEPGENTGTLRLNVLSFLTEEDVSLTYPLEVFKKRSSKNNGKIEGLSDNCFLLKYSINIVENGEDLVIFYWEVARMVSPRDYNIAVFNYTIGAKESRLAHSMQEVASIEEEVKKVRFWLHGNFYEG